MNNAEPAAGRDVPRSDGATGPRDILGLGLNWSRPSEQTYGAGLPDQYSVELFYRIQLLEHLAITPDIQVLVNPPLNLDADVIAVFGLRARLAFLVTSRSESAQTRRIGRPPPNLRGPRGMTASTCFQTGSRTSALLEKSFTTTRNGKWGQDAPTTLFTPAPE